MTSTYRPESGQKVAPISIENETKVMRNIAKMCTKAIQAFPRSLKEDYKLLDSKNLTQNQRNAITYTIREREALGGLGSFSDWIKGTLML